MQIIRELLPSFAVSLVPTIRIACITVIWNPVFFSETFRSFFGETFWSLKHFGRLSHTCIKARVDKNHDFFKKLELFKF